MEQVFFAMTMQLEGVATKINFLMGEAFWHSIKQQNSSAAATSFLELLDTYKRSALFLINAFVGVRMFISIM